MSDTLTIQHYDAEETEDTLDAVIGLYTASHADLIATDPFLSVERFLERLAGYRRAPGFELVIAHAEGTPVGLAFGYTLPRNAAWWDGLLTPADPNLIAETGTRTFALNEIMVHPNHQRSGIARTVHTALMTGRTEDRATLLVRSDNEPAQAAYRRWGYTSIGKLKPFADAPVYDALILPLHADSS